MSLRRRAFILLILIGFLIVPFRVNAVELTKTFEGKISEHNTNYAIFPSYDNKGKMNGYVVLTHHGSSGSNCGYLVYYDDVVSKFNLKDEKIFGYIEAKDIPFSFSQDGKNTSYLLKDSSGNILWQRQYGKDIKNFSYYADYDENGNITGYVALLYTDSTDIDGIKPGHIIIKYDKNGNLLWQKNFNYTFGVAYDFRVSSYYVYGKGGDYFFFDDYDAKYYSSTGELVWEKAFNNISFIGPSYFENKFDGVVIIDRSDCIVKYDFNGNEVFNIQINIPDNYHSIHDGYILPSRNSNGDYEGYIAFVPAYYGNGNNIYKTHLIKYDYQGNVTWSDVIDNFLIEDALMESYDENGRFNGYAFTGDSSSDDGNEMGGTVIKYTYPKYDVVSDNDKGGVISVSDKAYAGDVVKVEVKAKAGYVVKRIVVKDETGKEIEVSSDGTFVMPEGKVTVSAIYERIENPDTVSASYIVLGIVLIISIGTIMILKRKKDKKLS